jgi:hypothetical protein
VDDGRTTHGLEILKKLFHAVWVTDGLPGAQVEESSEKVAKDAGEYVDMELLVGPMELGTQRDMDGVFEVCKDGLHIGLSSVGANDVGGGPVIAIGDEDDPAEGLVVEGAECGLVESVGQSKPSL